MFKVKLCLKTIDVEIAIMVEPIMFCLGNRRSSLIYCVEKIFQDFYAIAVQLLMELTSN